MPRAMLNFTLVDNHFELLAAHSRYLQHVRTFKHRQGASATSVAADGLDDPFPDTLPSLVLRLEKTLRDMMAQKATPSPLRFKTNTRRATDCPRRVGRLIKRISTRCPRPSFPSCA
ncbi:Aste57867_11442 [Aphanomyces stellatus]|uniref:Aste57867_11442 protein n=1 Tax=Aphanomyces stellatus TaxID=120398 RepID=A0A485KTL2_9STRA|nr:hypothetical protein As57867_011400 [Aphanomyces stellatus]VFT88303.1 Aste57867_11442 [Aphanomyces stellatus]